jgi:hypothetical protein
MLIEGKNKALVVGPTSLRAPVTTGFAGEDHSFIMAGTIHQFVSNTEDTSCSGFPSWYGLAPRGASASR